MPNAEDAANQTEENDENLLNCLDPHCEPFLNKTVQNIRTNKLIKNWIPPSDLKPKLPIGTILAKKIPICNTKEERLQLQQEYELLSQCNHKNIVTTFAMKDNGETIFFVMEAGEQSLYGFLYSEVPTFPGDTSNEIATGYTMRRCLTWLKHIAEGLDYLHSKNILHRDVKSGNVLLFEDGTICKVCDLDLSRKDDTPEKSGGKGTGPYMAPEIQLDRRSKYTLKVDCFSFGVLMLECLIREFPQERPTYVDVPGRSTFREKVDEKFKFEFLREVIKLLLSSEPEERPSFKLIVSQLETCLPNSDLPRLQKPCVPGVENKENYPSPAPEIPSIPRTGLTLYYSVENSHSNQKATNSEKERIAEILKTLSRQIKWAGQREVEYYQVEHHFKVCNPIYPKEFCRLEHTIASKNDEVQQKCFNYCKKHPDHIDWMRRKFEDEPGLLLDFKVDNKNPAAPDEE